MSTNPEHYLSSLKLQPENSDWQILERCAMLPKNSVEIAHQIIQDDATYSTVITMYYFAPTGRYYATIGGETVLLYIQKKLSLL